MPHMGSIRSIKNYFSYLCGKLISIHIHHYLCIRKNLYESYIITTTEIINYLLSEGYQFVLKLFSSSRAKSLVGAGRCGSEQIPTPKWQSDQCHQREYVVLDSLANSLYAKAKSGSALIAFFKSSSTTGRFLVRMNNIACL